MNESKTCANQTAMHEPLASTDLNTASSVDAVRKIPTGEIGNAQGRRGMAPDQTSDVAG